MPDTRLVDLYALPPEEFIAARDAAGRTDKAVKQLRRPTLSAWVVNTLVRRDPRLVEQLVELGRELGAAQTHQDATALRTLTEQRRQVVAATVDRAVTLAGRDVAATVRDEVAATLEAALSDPASGEAVRTGRLVRPLAYAGFGSVDLAGAVADLPAARPEAATQDQQRRNPRRPAPPTSAPPTSAPPTSAPPTSAATASVRPEPRRPDPRLERAALAAAGALDDAVQRADTAARTAEQDETNAADADRHLERAQAAVSSAEQELVTAREAVREATRRRTADRRTAAAARTKATAARDAVSEAQHQADGARQALDRDRRAGGTAQPGRSHQ